MTYTLFFLALVIVVGFLGASAVHKIRLPAVTGYLVAGLVLGLTQVIPQEALISFGLLSNLALGFIAFSIGSQFKWSFLKQVGKTPLLITLFEALGAVFVLDLLLILAGVPVPAAILLGAIGSATAPAATLMVIRQYNADGPVTRMLLPVVAMDDAVALLSFSISAALARVLISGGPLTMAALFASPLLEISGSLAVGALLGGLTAWSLRHLHQDTDRMQLALVIVLAGVGLSAMWDLSSLLTCMMAGAVFTNFSRRPDKLLKLSEAFTPPLYLIFFVLSGAELEVSVLKEIGLVGTLYILGRVVGKIGGCYLGARLAKAEPAVQKYLGFTLIPQAGVAIGLSLAALEIVPEHGAMIRAVILCATLVYELVGPLITKETLSRAGEIEQGECR